MRKGKVTDDPEKKEDNNCLELLEKRFTRNFV